MKYVLTLGLVGVFAVAMALSALPQAMGQSQTVSGVASVIDGDTIEIHGERIRLGALMRPKAARVVVARMSTISRPTHWLIALDRAP